MKVLDLQCRHGHVFEGWFGSEEDFQSQRERRLVQCPLCGDGQIEKRLSAPRLNLGRREPGGSAEPEAIRPQAPVRQGQGSSGAAAHAPPTAVQAAWLDLARKIVASTENVGPRFAQEARRMHHGEVPERAIRGQATADEAEQLLDEGIAVVPLALPKGATETLQ